MTNENIVLNSENMLWRYMDLSKFLSMINKEELFFTAAYKFEDPFEGAKGLMKDKEKYNTALLDYLKQSPLWENYFKDPESPENRDVLNRAILAWENFGKKRTTDTFINCWHMNDVESEAMWKIYSKDITNAIAIQTTYNRLKNVLEKYQAISISKVEYSDYETPDFFRNSFLTKRKSFKYEQEVRAIIHCTQSAGETGLGIPVDLDILIEKIYISPYAPVWFAELVESIINKFNINKEVLKSNMLEEPYFSR